MKDLSSKTEKLIEILEIAKEKWKRVSQTSTSYDLPRASLSNYKDPRVIANAVSALSEIVSALQNIPRPPKAKGANDSNTVNLKDLAIDSPTERKALSHVLSAAREVISILKVGKLQQNILETSNPLQKHLKDFYAHLAICSNITYGHTSNDIVNVVHFRKRQSMKEKQWAVFTLNSSPKTAFYCDRMCEGLQPENLVIIAFEGTSTLTDIQKGIISE